MKTIHTIAVAAILLNVFVSCQSTSGQKQGLSNKETRQEMMNTIAGDSTMSKEMIGAMMNSKNGMMMVQEHSMMTGDYSSMMHTLKGNPGMMQNMISAMMETAKGDTTMMSGMIRTMMGNQKMMGMMQNMTGSNMMNNMERMDSKSNH